MQILVKDIAVVGDRIIAVIDDPMKIAAVKKYCNKKKNVLDILPYFQKRSTGRKSQNNHIWKHAKDIARELGWDYRACEYEARCQAMNMGYPQATHPSTCAPVFDLNDRPVPKDIKEANQQEAHMVIECLHMIAAESGIKLPEGPEHNEEEE